MRDSILRVIDDIETKKEEVEGLRDKAAIASQKYAFFDGHVCALNSVLKGLKLVLADHAQV